MAEDYHLHNGGTECFPNCTFKQDLVNWLVGAVYLAVLFAIGAVARWVQVGRRRPRKADVA